MTTPNDSPASVGRIPLEQASGTFGGGRYRIFASLGRGGMAEVQLGTLPGPKGFNKLVVVKRLRALLAEDAAMVNMFLDEARLAARLNHPNLIHTYEFGEERGAYFMVMEFLEGQPLGRVLDAVWSSGRSVSPSVWARIVADTLAGLHHAHELRDYDGTPLHVVHRDVSPQNIVVTYDGGVKLVDFGVARAAVNVTKTESQVIKGKLAYMAPEQAFPPEGEALDRRADVFAMGIVLWECLAQQRLVTGDARAAVVQIIDMEFRAPSLTNPQVPPELDAITRRALELAPGDRYPTAQAMREALERFLKGQGEVVDESVIGRLVRDLFAEEREVLHDKIRAQMAGLSSRDLTVDDSAPSEPDAVAVAARSAVAAPVLPTESVGSLRAVRTDPRGAPKRRGKPAVSTLAGIASAVVVTGALVALIRRPATPVAPLQSAPQGATPEAATPAASTAAKLATESSQSAASASGSEPPMRPAPEDAGRREAGNRRSVTPLRPSAPPPAHDSPPKLDPDPWR